MLASAVRERILGQSRNKAPRPNNPHALRSLIASQNPPPKFTYDLCSPKEYTFFWNCPKPPHFRIALEKDDKKNMFENECLKVLHPSGPLLSSLSMHLTRKTIEYFNKPEEELNDTQLHALSEIWRWGNSRMADILGPDKELDRSKLIPQNEMQAPGTGRAISSSAAPLADMSSGAHITLSEARKAWPGCRTGPYVTSGYALSLSTKIYLAAASYSTL
jgi:hypothetical protein